MTTPYHTVASQRSAFCSTENIKADMLAILRFPIHAARPRAQLAVTNYESRILVSEDVTISSVFNN